MKRMILVILLIALVISGLPLFTVLAENPTPIPIAPSQTINGGWQPGETESGSLCPGGCGPVQVAPSPAVTAGPPSVNIGCATKQDQPGAIFCTAQTSNKLPDALIEYQWSMDGTVQGDKKGADAAFTGLSSGSHVVAVVSRDIKNHLNSKADSVTLNVIGAAGASSSAASAVTATSAQPKPAAAPTTVIVKTSASSSKAATTTNAATTKAPSNAELEQAVIDSLTGTNDQAVLNRLRSGSPGYDPLLGISVYQDFIKATGGDPSKPTPSQQDLALSLGSAALTASMVDQAGAPLFPSLKASYGILTKMALNGATDPSAATAFERLKKLLMQMDAKALRGI